MFYVAFTNNATVNVPSEVEGDTDAGGTLIFAGAMTDDGGSGVWTVGSATTGSTIASEVEFTDGGISNSSFTLGNDGEVAFDGGTFTLSGATMSGGGLVSLESGTLQLNSDLPVDNFSETGGVLTAGSGDVPLLSVSSSLVWNAGSMEGGGTTEVESTAWAHLYAWGGDDTDVLDGWDMLNYGTATWEGGPMSESDGSSFVNESPYGTLAIGSARNYWYLGSGSGTFTNNGIINVTEGAYAVFYVAFTNNATVNVPSEVEGDTDAGGTLIFAGAMTDDGGSGVWTVGSATTGSTIASEVEFTDGGISNSSFTLGNDGEVAFDGGTFTLSGATMSGGGLVSLESGTLQLNSDLPVDNFSETGGVLTAGSGDVPLLSVSSSLVWNAGSMEGGGTTEVESTAWAHLYAWGGDDTDVLDGWDMLNYGTATWEGGPMSESDGSSFVNESPYGTLAIGSGANYWYLGSGSGTFTNNGIINVTEGAYAVFYVAFTNNATVNVPSEVEGDTDAGGTLIFAGAMTDDGGSGVWTVGSATTGSTIASEVEFTDGGISNSSFTLGNDGEVAFDGGTFTLSGATMSGGGLVSLESGTLDLDSNLTVTNLDTYSGIFADNASAFTVLGIWNDESGITFTAGSGTVILYGATLEGTGNPTFNNLAFEDDVTVTLSFQVDGTFTIDESAILTAGSNSITVEGGWTNNGTFTPVSSTVILGGSSPQSIDGSSCLTTFENLTVDDSAGVALWQSATVDATLTFTSGLVTLETGYTFENVAESPPYIEVTVIPSELLAVSGQPETISISTNDSSSPSQGVQWQYSSNGVDWYNASGGVYSDDTTDTLSISNAAGLNLYQFRVIFTNATWGYGQVASVDITLDVATATWSSDPAPNPTIESISNQTNTEDTSGDFVDVSASDPSGYSSYALTYAAINLPGGLSINSSTGIISGTVSYGTAADFGGVYNPTIIVVDGHGGSASTSFFWTINPATTGLSADTVDSQTNAIGDTVSVPITASDPDSYPFFYTAENLPDGVGIDPSTGVISGTIAPDAASSTAYSVTVNASNGYASASTTFSWTVNTASLSPQLSNPGNQVNASGDQVYLPLSGYAPDGSALTYIANDLPGGLSVDPVTGVISGTITNTAASTMPYMVTVIANNGSESAIQSFSWTVNAVEITNPGDQSSVFGDKVNLQISATNAGSGTLTFSATGLPAGLSIDSAGLITGTIETTDTSSPYQVAISAGGVSTQFNWTISQLAVNDVGDQTNIAGQQIYLQMTGDAGADGSIAYTQTGLPTDLTITSGGLISGTVTTPGTYNVVITGTDGSYTGTDSFTWTVLPQLTLQLKPQGYAVGDYVSYAVDGADSLGEPFTYNEVGGLPGGLTIDTTTGLIYGTITASPGTYPVTVTATAGSYSASETVPWTVAALYVSPPATQNSLVGATVSLAVAVSDHTGAGPITYSETGLPTGLNIDPNTGIISGIIAPGADGASPYTVTVDATDGTNSGSQTFTWNVAPTALATPADQTDLEGTTITPLSLTGTDVAGYLTYSAYGLPAGLTINPTSGEISGVIATGDAADSPYSVTVTATDSTSNSSVSQTFSWTVNPVVKLSDPGDQSNAVGDDGIDVPLFASDAYGYAVTYTATGLPASLTISSNAIVGNIVSGDVTDSPYTVTVTATDTAGNKSSQTFSWQLGQISFLSNPGDQNSADGQTVPTIDLTAYDNNGYTPTYGVTGLPLGVTLEGSTISGSITDGDEKDSPYTVVVTASDGHGHSVEQTFIWNVSAPPAPEPRHANLRRWRLPEFRVS